METVGLIAAIILVVGCSAAMVWINRGGLFRARDARGKPPLRPLSPAGRVVALGLAVLAVLLGFMLTSHR